MPARAKATAPKDSTATIGFEAKLWLTADKLRNNMDAAEPSGARQTATGSPKGERGGENQYKAENVFWVPADARWSHLQASAKQPTIGKTVDDAMVAIERDNPRLKGVLPKDYAHPGLHKDGFFTLDEFKAGSKRQENLEARFNSFDKNSDGKLTREEFVRASGKWIHTTHC